MRKILLPFVAMVLTLTATSQNSDRCGSMELIKQQMAIDPAYAKKVREAQNNKGHYSRPENRGGPVSYTIPVAVHVLYYSADQNISDAQVQSQIDVMNEDFTASNHDYRDYDAGYGSVRGDMDLRFCLVQVIHKQTQHKSFGVNDNMKYSNKGGSDAIDPMHVLNIWVCDLGLKVLGFAYYPGITPEKFGVVCHTKAFGRGAQYNLFTKYNLGRTVTHEVGHCFGLVHIWGDAHCGSDLVDDTPLHNDPNFDCPGEGHLSTCQGTPLEMWMNYMDYTQDKCMYFFSDGQVSRSDFFIDNDPQLNSIVHSSCTVRSANSEPVTSGSSQNIIRRVSNNGFTIYPTITSGPLVLSAANSKAGQAEILIYNGTGVLVMKQRVFVAEGNTTNNLNVGKLTDGIYFIQLNKDSEKKTGKFILQH